MWVHSGIMKTFNCNISTQFVENKSIFLRMENRRISVFFFCLPNIWYDFLVCLFVLYFSMICFIEQSHDFLSSCIFYIPNTFIR